MIRRFCWFAILVLGALSTGAAAQGYPARPVQMVVWFPPGSGSDGIARIVSAKLAIELGQPVVVLNRAGASGLIAAEYVAKAAPDGYTLFLASASVLTFNTATFAKLPYDPITDFAPISMIGKQPFVIAVSPTLPVTTLAEFVTLAKSQPNKLTYGNTGSSAELAVELFCSVTGIHLLGIPYKGGYGRGRNRAHGERDRPRDGSEHDHLSAGRGQEAALSGGDVSKALAIRTRIADRHGKRLCQLRCQHVVGVGSSRTHAARHHRAVAREAAQGACAGRSEAATRISNRRGGVFFSRPSCMAHRQRRRSLAADRRAGGNQASVVARRQQREPGRRTPVSD